MGDILIQITDQPITLLGGVAYGSICLYLPVNHKVSSNMVIKISIMCVNQEMAFSTVGIKRVNKPRQNKILLYFGCMCIV